MFGWLILVVLFGLAFFYPWCWIAAALVGFWKARLWYRYSGRPWRRIHYPMMLAYASAAGLEQGEAQKQGREFNLHNALRNLIRIPLPHWDDTLIDRFIARELERIEIFSDRDLLIGYVKKKKGYSDIKLEAFALLAQRHFVAPDNGLIVRMIIAGLIEGKYGESARGEYIFAVLTGRAD